VAREQRAVPRRRALEYYPDMDSSPQHGDRRPAPRHGWLPRGVLIAALATGLAAVALLAGRGSVAAQAVAQPHVQAASFVVMDEATGVIVNANDRDRELPMASCTKIMTALLVLERVKDRTRWVTVPKAAVDAPGATISLRAGDRITVQTLLAGMLTRSATDCSITLATTVAGSEKHFVVLMNKRAAALGLTHTRYANCSGIYAKVHYTSARDLAELGRIAMKLSAFRALVKPTSAVLRWRPGHVRRVESHNALNRRYKWVDGIKTGASASAKCCLASSGKYGGRRFIVVTLREPSRTQEVADHLKLYRYAASLYSMRIVVTAGAEVTRVPLAGGGEVSLIAQKPVSVLMRTAATVEVQLDGVPLEFDALPPTGTVEGTAVYSADGQQLGKVQLLAAGLASPSASPQP
jgi:D-alanyl-D-alanine carboxypeptidase